MSQLKASRLSRWAPWASVWGDSWVYWAVLGVSGVLGVLSVVSTAPRVPLSLPLPPAPLLGKLLSLHSLLAGALAVGVVSLVARALAVLARARRMQKVLRDMPGPPPTPLIGNVSELVSTNEQFWTRMTDLVAKYAPTFRFWVGPVPFVVLTDPRDFDHVMNSPKFNDKSSWYPMAESALGQGLIVLSGETWRRHRKAVSPSLHHQVLLQNVEVFHRKTKDMAAAHLEPMVESSAVFDIRDFCNMVSMDCVCETMLSSDLPYDALKRFVDEKNHACDLVVERVHSPWLLVDGLYALTAQAREARRIEKLTNVFIDEIIERRRQKQQQQRKPADQGGVQEAADSEGQPPAPYSSVSRRRTFLEHVLEDAGATALLSDREVREEAKAMVIAGEGTVANALSFVILMLAMHPQAQRKVHQELEDTFGSDPELRRAVTSEELPHLGYLERVIQETLRLFPLVAVFARDCPHDIVLPTGYAVPRGAHLLMFTYHTHRNPAFYPDPLKFDPDRFLPEQVRSRPTLSNMTFSAGARSCIGQRYAIIYLKTVLATLLRRFEVHVPPGDTRSIADLPIEIGVILTITDGFQIRVTKRKPCQ